MKHEFKTTKTTKNVNNLLPATDEELGLELLEFSEDMMLKGMEIALKKRTNIKKISVPPINDSFYEKAFSIIGKKHNIAAENVHKYIYILMQEIQQRRTCCRDWQCISYESLRNRNNKDFQKLRCIYSELVESPEE